MSDTTATGTSEATSTEAVSSGPETSSAPETSPANPEAQSSQGNPAWDGMRSKLGDQFFKLIEKDLADQDAKAQARITEANAKAKQYEAFGSLEDIQQAVNLVKQVGESPLEVHERLGSWLRQNGMIQEAEAVEAAAEDLEEDEGTEDEAEAPEDPRIQFLLEQEHQRAVEKADTQFKSQMSDIRKANEWMSEDDETEILQRALDNAERSGSDVDLAGAAEQYIQLRTRFLQTPRPKDSAPQLVPSGGGAPARNSTFDFSKASAEERQKYVAEYLKNQQ